MKKIIALALVALVLIACVSCASVSAEDTASNDAELEALRAENARLSAELDTVKAENAALLAEAIDNFYTRTGLVADLDYDTDIVTVVDGVGASWQFFGCEDYCIGDLVEMLMQRAGDPESIFDDVIYSTSYAGFYTEYFQD